MNVDLFSLIALFSLGAVFGYLTGHLRLERNLRWLRQEIRNLLWGKEATGPTVPAETDDKELVTSIRELIQEHHRLKDRTRELEEVLYQLPKGILILSRKGLIHSVNPSLLEILEAPGTMESWKDRDPLELFRAEVLHSAIEQAARGIPPDRPILIEKGERILEVSIVSLGLKNLNLLLTWEDVTSSVRAEETAEDLIANVAHELRTPLTSIKGYAETLLDSTVEDPALRERFLKVILSNADRLSNLVRDVLVLARMDASIREELERDVMDLEAILNQAVDASMPLAQRRGIRIRKEISATRCMVEGFQQDLEHAILNLLDNAIKYTVPKSEVVAGLKESAGEILVFVKDQGPGIPKDAQERIFERFYRLDKDRSRKLGGTGLGLAIVRQVAKDHGGRAWVESTWGKGACFYLALPCCPPH